MFVAMLETAITKVHCNIKPNYGMSPNHKIQSIVTSQGHFSDCGHFELYLVNGIGNNYLQYLVIAFCCVFEVYSDLVIPFCGERIASLFYLS